MFKRNFYKLLAIVLISAFFMGCTASRVEWDKAAIMEINKVAVVLYTAPLSIEYYDDPVTKEKGTLASMVAIATSENGSQAASKALAGFTNQMNQEKLGFKFVTQEEMMQNTAFIEVTKKHLALVADRKAKAAAAKAAEDAKASTAMKALSFLSSVADADGAVPTHEGAGPKGLPEFGLAQVWKTAPSALMSAEGEMEYIKEATKALGVDAVLVVNEPGFSFGCEACVAGVGSGTTQTAFLATMLDRDGEVILEMRQWWSVGGGSAAMAAYIINPLQHDSLFEKHGAKTARVFAEYYREEGGK